MWIDALLLAGGFALAFGIGTFVEWLVHYLMHRRVMLGKVHTQHHKEGWGQGWFGEFLVYFLSALPFMIGCWLIAWQLLDIPWFGIGMILGGTFYAAFAAYAHQVQHERPELTFWMRRPVHYVHHVHSMWHHNFGISFDIWDRVFGTYKYVEWRPARPVRLLDFFRIHWYYYKPTTDEAKPLKSAPRIPGEPMEQAGSIA